MARIADLSIKRKQVEHETAFSRYWSEHAPDAADLAELFGISTRRVRELWQEGWLTKGGNLSRAINEYRTYRVEVLGKPGHVGGARTRRG